MEMVREMLSYPFLVRALVGGILVSLCASLLGVSLVLKRYSMIGDGLSHVSFGALSIAVAAGWSPLKISIPVVVLAAFFLLRITELCQLSGYRYYRYILNNRNDHRCKQLYVRKYSGHEQDGCQTHRGLKHCGFGAVSDLLQ